MEEMGMKLNKQKTEVMAVTRDRETIDIRIQGEEIRQVISFVYLGITFEEQGQIEREMTRRIDKFTRNVGMLYPILRERAVPVKVKVTIYCSILRPILTYGSECWSLNTNQKAKVEAAEMKVLRLIRGVTRRDRVRSESIRRDLGVLPVLTVVERNQLRWYGHMKRMNEERLPRRLYDHVPLGSRPVGRPRKRWRDAVSEAVRRRGRELAEVEEQRMYEDRETWRAFQRLVA